MHYNSTVSKTGHHFSNLRRRYFSKIILFSPSSLHSNRKRAVTGVYLLLSTFFKKHFNPHVRPILMVIKKPREAKWWMVTKHYRTIILEIRQCEFHCFVRNEFCVYSIKWYTKTSLFISFFSCINSACIHWYAISPQFVICTQHA